jgi:transposase
LRRSLYAAALPAAFRWNKALIALYTRLTAAGKAHNAALIACARKLLIYPNTVVQRGTPWTEGRSAFNGWYGLYGFLRACGLLYPCMSR